MGGGRLQCDPAEDRVQALRGGGMNETFPRRSLQPGSRASARRAIRAIHQDIQESIGCLMDPINSSNGRQLGLGWSKPPSGMLSPANL